MNSIRISMIAMGSMDSSKPKLCFILLYVLLSRISDDLCVIHAQQKIIII